MADLTQDLAHIDALLAQVDAVRASLPAFVQAASAPPFPNNSNAARRSSLFSNAATAQLVKKRVEEYNGTLKNGYDQLERLEITLKDANNLLSNVQNSYAKDQGDVHLAPRVKRTTHTASLIVSKSRKKTSFHPSVPFNSDAGPMVLADYLEALAALFPAISIQAIAASNTPNYLLIGVNGICNAYLFLHWSRRENGAIHMPSVDRISCLGLAESGQMYTTSSHQLFQKLSILLTSSIHATDSFQINNVEAAFSLLSSTSSLFAAPCSAAKCPTMRSTLDKALNPPMVRIYRSDASGENAAWDAFHEGCWDNEKELQ